MALRLAEVLMNGRQRLRTKTGTHNRRGLARKIESELGYQILLAVIRILRAGHRTPYGKDWREWRRYRRDEQVIHTAIAVIDELERKEFERQARERQRWRELELELEHRRKAPE